MAFGISTLLFKFIASFSDQILILSKLFLFPVIGVLVVVVDDDDEDENTGLVVQSSYCEIVIFSGGGTFGVGVVTGVVPGMVGFGMVI